MAGAAWYQQQGWFFIDVQDTYVRLKYEVTSRIHTEGFRKPDRFVYRPSPRTLSDLDRISQRLRAIGFSRRATLITTSEHTGGQLDYGELEGALETSASRIETFTFDIGAGCQSKSWLLHPKNAGDKIDKLLIVHQGHSSYLTFSPGNPANDVTPAINAALEAGIHVGVFFMPFRGEANGCFIQYDDPIAGPINIRDHGGFDAALGFEGVFGFHPFAMFLSPIKAYIDLLKNRDQNMRVYMTGLSGGGWTTTVYAASDERIEIAFPVAGNIPDTIRNQVPIVPLTDYETNYISTFADYSDLYVLATMRKGKFERRHISIFNDSDSCCFASKLFDVKSLENAINTSIATLSGGVPSPLYKIFESYNVRHSIERDAANYMIEKILSDE